MSDAAHLLSDILGFVISIFSIYIGQRKANAKMSFGYHRAEVIGALVSVNIIWGLTLWLFYEATMRMFSNEPVDGLVMLITAVLGFFFNIIMGLILSYQGIDHSMHSHSHDDKHSHSHVDHGHDNELVIKKVLLNPGENYDDGHGHVHEEGHDHSHDDGHGHSHDDGHGHSHDDVKTGHHGKDEHGHSHEKPKSSNKTKKENDNHGHSHGDEEEDDEEENINVRAALIHVLGDAIQNLGVVVAGLIIYFCPHLSIADPICTYIFSIIVLITTMGVMQRCLSVLMEEAPLKMDIDQLQRDFEALEGGVKCHDLHVWALSHSKLSLSCHLISHEPQKTLERALSLCKNVYKIKHCTIQVEETGGDNICDDHGIH